MGKKYEELKLEELEELKEHFYDSKRKKEEYYEEILIENGFLANIFQKGKKLELINYLIEFKKKLVVTENEAGIHFLESIFRKKDLEIIEELRNNLNEKFYEDTGYYEEWDSFEIRSKAIKKELEIISTIPIIECSIEQIADYNSRGKLYCSDLKKILYICENERIYWNNLIPYLISEILDFFYYSISNIYFSALTPVKDRERIFTIIKEELVYLESRFIDKNIEIKKIKEKSKRKDIFKKDPLVFFRFYISLHYELVKKEKNLNFYKNDMAETYCEIENIKYTVSDSDIELKFKDMESEKKKDNLFKTRINEIKEIISILDKQNGGMIIPYDKNFIKMMYKLFYCSDIKINNKKIYTVVRNIIKNPLETKEEIAKIDGILKKQIWLEKGKLKDYNNYEKLIKLLIEILYKTFKNYNFFKVAEHIKDVIDATNQILERIDKELEVIKELYDYDIDKV